MDPTWQLIFYIFALAAFAVSFVFSVVSRNVPLGLAAAGGVFLAVPLIWNVSEYV